MAGMVVVEVLVDDEWLEPHALRPSDAPASASTMETGNAEGVRILLTYRLVRPSRRALAK